MVKWFWKRQDANQSPEATPSLSIHSQAPQTASSSHRIDSNQSNISSNSQRKAGEYRFGLMVLVDQDEDDQDAVDIVAVHGLNGHYEKTWRAMNQSQQQVIWLRDFLPLQIPHARVMSFGYDSVALFSKSMATVGTFATQLLEELVARRRGQQSQRPLIFICHSLGGIVVKKAIIMAHEKARYECILDSIRGIMFFGTPHHGSSLASWASMMGNVASVASLGTMVNKRLTKDLETQSMILQEISKSFVDRATGLQLFSFFETDRTKWLNCRIVDEESATLGFPNEVQVPVKGDHRSICKFVSIDEPRYRCVWTNLQNISGSAAKEKPTNHQPEKGFGVDPRSKKTTISSLSTTEEKWQKIWDESHPTFLSTKREAELFNVSAVAEPPIQPNSLQTIQPELLDPEEEEQKQEVRKRIELARQAKLQALEAFSQVDYESHRHRIPGAVPGTCQWLLNNDKYLKWRRSEASELLWLSADPGCGKSVLTSYLVENLRLLDNKAQVPEAVCFFFFKGDNHDQDNASSAVCALLHQIYTTQPWLATHTVNAYLSHGHAITRQFAELWKVFMDSVTDTRSRDVVVIIDGLDECEPISRHLLLQSLTKLYTTEREKLLKPPFIKVIIASRPDNDIKIAFDVLPTIRLRGEDEPEAISKDVELVVRHHIENTVLRGFSRDVLLDLQTGLIEGADRTFLWTTLVIDLLGAKRGASKRELMEILQTRDIYKVYHQLLEESYDIAEARRVLFIVIAAARPMSLDEMSVAMAVDKSQGSLTTSRWTLYITSRSASKPCVETFSESCGRKSI